MFNRFKAAISNTVQKEIETVQKGIDKNNFIEETMKHHGQKATKFNATYQNERKWKSNYIIVNVVA